MRVDASDWGSDENDSLSHWAPVADETCEAQAVPTLIELYSADKRYNKLPGTEITGFARNRAKSLCDMLREDNDCIDDFTGYLRDAEAYGVDFPYLHGPLGIE